MDPSPFKSPSLHVASLCFEAHPDLPKTKQAGSALSHCSKQDVCLSLPDKTRSTKMPFVQAPSIGGCLASTSQLPQRSGRKCAQTHAELGGPSPGLLQRSSNTIPEQLLGNQNQQQALFLFRHQRSYC